MSVVYMAACCKSREVLDGQGSVGFFCGDNDEKK